MLKFLPLVLVSFSLFAQETPSESSPITKEKDKIYLASSRPLSSYYSHPLANALARSTDNEIHTMYISVGFGSGGTSSEQLMHSVALDISKVKPDVIIADELDANQYLLTLLDDSYKERILFVGRTIPSSLPREKVFRVSNLAGKIVSLVTEMNLFPDTYYVLYDTTGLTARDSYNLKKSLEGLSSTVKFYEISSIQELTDLMLEINKNQRGVIINNMTAIRDDEFGTVVRMKEIKEAIAKRNFKHLTIGFNYIPDAMNEGLILELDYLDIVRSYFLGGKKPNEMDPLKFTLYIDKSRLRLLGYKNNYIAALESISVIIE